MNPDVLIAGAGPVGLAMAAELVRYGVSVRIIDKNAGRSETSKALVLWSRTLELFDRTGCAPALVQAGVKVTGLSIATEAREVARVTLDGVASPHPYALMLPQSETERLLEEHLNANGVQVERQVELTAFNQTEQGVTATLRHADGSNETLSASWLAGCDGAHSTVRHTLGMAFAGDTLISDWVLADVHMTGVPQPPEVRVFWNSRGVLVLFPIVGNRYRMIADLGEAKSETHRPDPSLQEVQTLLDQRGPGGIQASNPVWLSAFRINERKVVDYRDGRVFLAGDAAHVHSPAGGQGMNTGMQDACNLAWKLALVRHGVCRPDPLLESYSVERSAVGEQVLTAAGRMTALAVIKNPVLQAVRNHVAAFVFGLSTVRRAMADGMTELSIAYPKSPLTHSGGHRHPAPGERAPIRTGEPLVGAGSSPRFALFAAPSEEASQLIARYPELLEPTPRAPFDDGGLWLVRPDGYVAMAAAPGAWSEVGTYLDQLAGGPS
jgi:2-polyprenyl-6-methoxyphenol hydroxylase-like FAD-dependent oxidoreductase